MTKKSSYDTVQARLEFYCCKHSKGKAFKPCPVFKNVAYLQESYKIAVFHNDDEEHLHELNPNYDTPTNFHFTPEQEKIIEEGIDSNSSNLFILKKIKQRNAHTNGFFPSLLQVGTKKKNMSKHKVKYNIVSYEAIEKYAESNQDVPKDEDKCYVAFHKIDKKNLRFTLIWSKRG